MQDVWQYSTIQNSACKVIERVGLPDVRQFWLSGCDMDESEWKCELQSARQIVLKIGPLLMLHIVKEGAQ